MESLFGLLGLFFLLLMLVVGILFLLIQQKTLEAISVENRMIAPSQVWLQLIPLFNLYWYFVVVNKLAGSIGAEFTNLSIDRTEQKPTQNTGITTGIVYLVALIPLDELKGIASLIWIVCFITYWAQLNKCKNKIIANKDNYLLDIEREMMDKE